MSDSGVGYISVTLYQVVLVLRWVTLYVTGHSGLLSLLPSVEWEMCTGQGAVAGSMIVGIEFHQPCIYKLGGV